MWVERLAGDLMRPTLRHALSPPQRILNVLFCDGFRTPAHHGPCHALRAGVRKPPKNETAGGDARWSRDVAVYGDLRAVRRGIMVPSAGRGSSRGIDDGDEAESGGRDWGTIGGIEWAK
jgi:hypothetical protein